MELANKNPVLTVSAFIVEVLGRLNTTPLILLTVKACVLKTTDAIEDASTCCVLAKSVCTVLAVIEDAIKTFTTAVLILAVLAFSVSTVKAEVEKVDKNPTDPAKFTVDKVLKKAFTPANEREDMLETVNVFVKRALVLILLILNKLRLSMFADKLDVIIEEINKLLKLKLIVERVDIYPTFAARDIEENEEMVAVLTNKFMIEKLFSVRDEKVPVTNRKELVERVVVSTFVVSSSMVERVETNPTLANKFVVDKVEINALLAFKKTVEIVLNKRVFTKKELTFKTCVDTVENNPVAAVRKPVEIVENDAVFPVRVPAETDWINPLFTAKVPTDNVLVIRDDTFNELTVRK